jgi:hypothetical protein
MPMLGRAAACAILIVAGAAPALADSRSEALFGDFIAWVDSSPEWSASVSLVRSEGAETIAEGIVFGREAPHVAISVEELRLRNLEARPGGGFYAARIEMGGGAIITEFMEAAIPAGAIAEISMPSLAGLTFDVEQMMTSIAGFYSLAAAGEIGELAIPEVRIVQRQPVPGAQPVETRASYRNLSFGPLSGGLIESQSAGPLSVSSKAPDGSDLTMAIASVSAERMDVAAMAHILDESRYREGSGDNIWRPLFSRASYSGLTAEGADGARFQVDSVSIENVDGRQPEEPFTELWDRIMNPAVPQEAKNDLALEAFSAMFRAWRVGTLRVDGVSARAPDEGGAFSLEGVTLSGISNEGVDSVIAKSMRAEGPLAFASLGSFELAGFVAPDFKALTEFAALEKGVDAEKHEAAIRAAFAALPRIAHVGLHELVAGKTQSEAVAMDLFTLDFADWNDIFAEATDIRVSGLAVPVEILQLDAETAEMAATLGYERFVLGMSLSDRWSPDAGTDSATWTFSLEDGADIALSYTLTGLTIDWLMKASAAAGSTEDNEAALMAMLDDLSLKSASLEVTDRTLLNRAFAVAAEKQGLTIEGPIYRQQMRAALPFLMATVLPSDFAKKVSPPLQAFLEGGRTLIADLSPAEPVGMLAVLAGAADPLGLTTLLNLTLSTEAAD